MIYSIIISKELCASIRMDPIRFKHDKTHREKLISHCDELLP